MTTFDETIASLRQDLIDAEADIQAALYSMRSRVTDLKVVTHQRRDRASEQGRPGFFREELGLARHIDLVQTRADMEHTTTSLNHKNWASVVNALMETSSGCVEDGNKIALRIDTLKSALRTMHLLQQHLATGKPPPALPEPPVPVPAAALPARTEPPAIMPPMLTMSATVAAQPEYLMDELAGINFADEADLRADQDAQETAAQDEDRSMSEALDEGDDDDEA